MKSKFSPRNKPLFTLVFWMLANYAQAAPGLFPEGLWLDATGSANILPFDASGLGVQTSLQYSAENGGIFLYSGAQESSVGSVDGGILFMGSPVSVVLEQGQGTNAPTFNIWKSSEYDPLGSPTFSINGSTAASTFTGSAVAINGGSLKVDGSPVLTAASAPALLTGQNFLQLSGGNLVLVSTTASSGSTNGALTVAGGIGVSKDSYISGIQIGRGPGDNLTVTSSNIVLGDNSFLANTSGKFNTAVGKDVLTSNTSGEFNTAVGYGSLSVNTTGKSNSAVGLRALFSNTAGTENTVTGMWGMHDNTSGSQNTAQGYYALGGNTTGSNNTALGYQAGRIKASGTNLTTPSKGVYIGWNSRGRQNIETNSIVIGADAVGNGSNSTVIGNISTTKTQIFGSLEVGALAVEGTHTTWNETDSLMTLSNGAVSFNTSAAITTRKNGQTTLTNKAWKADPDVAPTTANSNGEALVVEGHTRLKGKVVIESPQGDISMGIYGN